MSRLSLAITALLACGCTSDEPDSASLDGAYFGDFTIKHNDSARSIFAAAALTVAGDGNVAGSTLTTTDPTSIVGELATVTGRLHATDDLTIEADLGFAFPTLGRFTAKGQILHAGTNGGLAGMLTTRDAQNAVIGQTLIVVQR